MLIDCIAHMPEKGVIRDNARITAKEKMKNTPAISPLPRVERKVRMKTILSMAGILN
jgi:hypothetical protein